MKFPSKFEGECEIEVDPSREYLILTLPIAKLDLYVSDWLHKRNAKVTVKVLEE